MQKEQKIFRALRRRLLAGASALALRVALRPRGWASGLLALGLIGAPAPALAQRTVDLATEADVTIQGAAAFDFSAPVSGAGDVNGDGIDDLIIGASGASPNGRNDAGASYVIFGSDQGFPATIDLASDADLIIQGATADELSGLSVSGAGDVNGDGIDDLIVGAPGYGGLLNGVSYVVFGTDQGFPATIDLLTGADVTIQGPRAGYDLSGFSVSGAGDVNGDGIDDLLIGAVGASPNGRLYAGASYVVFGTDQGFPATIDLADPVNGADLIIEGAAAYDGFGGSVSGAGDVNGDGIDDLIIGAPLAAPNGRLYAGVSHVVFGAMDLSGTIDLADPVNGVDLVIQGAAADDRSGISVSGAGDVDGDGLDDLLIGAPNASPNDRNYAGASYVVFGTDQGFPATIDLADPVNGADLVIQGAAERDFAGTVSGAGDVSGDGIDDLLIGAGGASPNDRLRAGASYVVFGTDQGFPATIDLADPVNGADLIIEGAAAYDGSGRVSGAGDVNGDGIDDLLISAGGASPNDRPFAGASYVVFGTTADPAAALEDLITDVEAAGLQPRIEKILTKTLSKALDNLNKGRERGAIIALRLFVIKKIDEADADAWIADAEAIIDTLKAQKDRHRAPYHDAPSPMVEAQE